MNSICNKFKWYFSLKCIFIIWSSNCNKKPVKQAVKGLSKGNSLLFSKLQQELLEMLWVVFKTCDLIVHHYQITYKAVCHFWKDLCNQVLSNTIIINEHKWTLHVYVLSYYMQLTISSVEWLVLLSDFISLEYSSTRFGTTHARLGNAIDALFCKFHNARDQSIIYLFIHRHHRCFNSFFKFSLGVSWIPQFSNCI